MESSAEEFSEDEKINEKSNEDNSREEKEESSLLDKTDQFNQEKEVQQKLSIREENDEKIEESCEPSTSAQQRPSSPTPSEHSETEEKRRRESE